MECEWDEKKNKLNQKKHGISFEEAQEVFHDPNAIEYFDEGHSEEEDRYICLGDIGELVIVVVVYTDRNGVARLISARPAEQSEEKKYYEHVKKTT